MINPLEICSKGDVIEIEFLTLSSLVCIKKIGDRNQIISSSLIDTESLLNSFSDNNKMLFYICGYSIEDTVTKKTRTTIDTVINDLILHLFLNNICQKIIENISRFVFDSKLNRIIKNNYNSAFLSINTEFSFNPSICDLIKFTSACLEQTNKSCIIRLKPC